MRFLEHGAGVIVFLCERCQRAIVRRAGAVPAETAQVTREAFVFPQWFTGGTERLHSVLRSKQLR